MEENKKPETTSQQDSAPVDYSRYMGTLNRIYRRNNNPKKKRLGDGHQNVLNHIKTARNDLLLSFRAVLAGGICYRGCQIR